MKAFAIAATIVAIIGLTATGYLYQANQKAEQEAAALRPLEDANNELTFKVQNLETQVADLSKQLEEEVAKLSKQKEEEIQRLSGAQEQLVKELQNEINKKQIEITQLADRLSVTMVDKILFPSGEANLTPEGLKVLERVGNIIKNVEDKIIRVEGHTDSIRIHPRLQKKFASNWELSTARATNVVRFLQDKVGIDPHRLHAVGLAQFQPVASNKTSEGRSKNRRIEIALLPLVEGPRALASK